MKSWQSLIVIEGYYHRSLLAGSLQVRSQLLPRVSRYLQVVFTSVSKMDPEVLPGGWGSEEVDPEGEALNLPDEPSSNPNL